MRQIELTEEDEAEILDQKEILQKYSRGRESLFKSLDNDKQQKQLFKDCLRLIERIYIVLHELESIGFALRTNKKAIRHCLEHQPWLQAVFLQRSANKKHAFQHRAKYFVVSDVQSAQRNFISTIMTGVNPDTYSMKEHLAVFVGELETSLSHKKTSELKQVAKYIENHVNDGPKKPWELTLNYQQCRGVGEKLNFENDLSLLEDRCGRITAITKVTRQKY